MSATSLVVKRQTSFQLKTSFAPCTILQILKYDLAALQTEIVHLIARAPNFFLGSPVIIDLEKIKSVSVIDFIQIKTILIANNLVPIGVRNGSSAQLELAAANGLPVLTIGKLNHAETDKKKPTQQVHTKIVTTPVRSGMQVYAKEADLIVIAPVSAGAEILADGNIHIYGPLRGRALAGVQGNKAARIFCHLLEAELISIAGYYLTKEDMQALSETRGMIQVYLQQEQLKIETIS